MHHYTQHNPTRVHHHKCRLALVQNRVPAQFTIYKVKQPNSTHVHHSHVHTVHTSTPAHPTCKTAQQHYCMIHIAQDYTSTTTYLHIRRKVKLQDMITYLHLNNSTLAQQHTCIIAHLFNSTSAQRYSCMSACLQNSTSEQETTAHQDNRTLIQRHN
jgi:hypothetical protein